MSKSLSKRYLKSSYPFPPPPPPPTWGSGIITSKQTIIHIKIPQAHTYKKKTPPTNNYPPVVIPTLPLLYLEATTLGLVEEGVPLQQILSPYSLLLFLSFVFLQQHLCQHNMVAKQQTTQCNDRKFPQNTIS